MREGVPLLVSKLGDLPLAASWCTDLPGQFHHSIFGGVPLAVEVEVSVNIVGKEVAL